MLWSVFVSFLLCSIISANLDDLIDFYVTNTNSPLTIANIVLTNPKAKSSIRADTVSLTLTNVSMS